MMTEENKKVLDDLVYLAACAVNGQIPEKSRTDGIDLSLVSGMGLLCRLLRRPCGKTPCWTRTGRS